MNFSGGCDTTLFVCNVNVSERTPHKHPRGDYSVQCNDNRLRVRVMTNMSNASLGKTIPRKHEKHMDAK